MIESSDGRTDEPLALGALATGPRSLWFVRHGQSEGNVIRDDAERRHAEHFELGMRDADVPLSDLGRRQASALGRWLAEQPAEVLPDAVLVSPYRRATQTADLVLAEAVRRIHDGESVSALFA